MGRGTTGARIVPEIGGEGRLWGGGEGASIVPEVDRRPFAGTHTSQRE